MQRGKRRLYEDLGLDREDDFQTDDEENQAQRVFEHLDDDTDSDNNSPTSRNLYNEVSIISWPQSYRNQYIMWDRNSYNSICNERMRVPQPYNTSNICYHVLLYWDAINKMFRKQTWTQNLPRYWSSYFWNWWSLGHCGE
ncbi:hypothetical protein JHK85_018891 [Glycine max]|nr:hypothetical protein JHK85_018891 [Glycine max]KAG5037644.1 hypothetical protein JHK86_018484 [Glycine max]